MLFRSKKKKKKKKVKHQFKGVNKEFLTVMNIRTNVIKDNGLNGNF